MRYLRRMIAKLLDYLAPIWHLVMVWSAIYIVIFVWFVYGVADVVRTHLAWQAYEELVITALLGLIWLAGLVGLFAMGRWIVYHVQDDRFAKVPARASGMHLPLSAEAMGEWVYWLAPDDTLLDCSPACERLTGYSHAEFVSEPDLVKRIIHPEDQANVLVQQRHTTPAQPGTLDVRILHRDGSVRWVAQTCQPVFDVRNQFHGVRVSNYDITDRKQLEESLRLRTAALQSAANAIMITGLTGKILFINPAFTRLTGYVEHEVLGKNPRSVFYSGKQDNAFYANLWKTVLAGQVWRGELVNTKKDGTLYTEEMIITPIRLVGGAVTHLVAVKQDITARKKAEHELARANALLRATLDSTTDGILVLGQNGEIVTYNQKFLELWHLSEEALTAPFAEQLATQVCDPAAFLARVTPLDSEMITPTIETFELKDGRVIECASTAYRLGGYQVGRLWSWRDVTISKRLERDLQTERDFAMQVINTMGQGLTVTDAQGRFELVNPAYARMFGYHSAELIGKYPRDVTCAQDHPQLEQARQARLRGETTSYESQLRCADGSYAPVLITGTPRWKDNQVVGAIAVITDLTKIKRAERLLVVQRDLAIKLGTATTLQDAFAHILDAAFATSGIDCGGIYVVHPRTGALDLAIHRGLPDAFVRASAHFKADDFQTRLVMQGEPIYTQYQQLVSDEENPRLSEGLRALAIVPVRHSGRVVAVLNLASHKYDDIPADSCRAIEAIAAQIGSVLEQIRTAEALRTSEANLHALFDSVTDLVIILDANGRIVHANAETRRRLGYSAENLQHMHVLQIHPADWRDQALQIIANMLEGKTNHCAIPLVGQDGTLIPVETRVVRGKWNDQPALFGISRDITERLRIESALRESEARFRQIFESSPIAIELYDDQARLIDANPACLELFGVTNLQAVRGFPLFKEPPSSEQHQTRLLAGMTVHTEIVFDFDRLLALHPFPTSKRGCMHLDVQITPLGFNGSVGGTGYLVQLQDISEHKRVQTHLEYASTHDALTGLYNRAFFDDAMARFKATEAMPVGIVMIDVDFMKTVNDRQGHAVGDDLLRRAAKVLRRAFRAQDIVARIGGDEFAVLLPHANPTVTQQVVERVRATLAQFNRDEKHTVAVSLSIGAATAERADELTQTLSTADAAMYLEKAQKHSGI